MIISKLKSDSKIISNYSNISHNQTILETKSSTIVTTQFQVFSK